MKRNKGIHALSPARKMAIIEAALNLFSEKGFTDTSMSDICRAAEASTGSVYHHFKSKEQLATAVYLEGIGEYQQGLVEALSREEKARAGIKAIIRFHLNWVKDHPLWARFLFQQRHAHFMDNSDNAINSLNRSFATGIALWLKEQIQKETIKPLSWDLIIAILLGPCQEFSRLYLSGKAASSIEESIDILAESAWQGLAVHPHGES